MRAFNRLASLVLGLLLVAGGVLLAAEAIMVLLNRPPVLVPLSSWYDWLRSVTLNGAVVLAVLGLVLLVAQLRPWRPVRVPVTVDDNWYVQRRGAEHGLVRAVDDVPGVTGAKAKVGKRWRCRVWATGDADSRADVDAAIDEELNRMSVPDGRRVRVKMARLRRVT